MISNPWKKGRSRFPILGTAAACWLAALSVPAAGIVDSISFGEAASEAAHALQEERSTAVTGEFAGPARLLLPLQPNEWRGGKVGFTLQVDPAGTNYFTLRLWGSDTTPNRLVLYLEGKQVGYFHLGDVDALDHGGDEPACAGKFFYSTTPLPLEMTRGRSKLRFEIRAMGRIWGYGKDFAEYQKPMTEPSRPLYRAYTHTDGCFTPPADEQQGRAPANPPVRAQPGPEVLDQVKQRVNGSVNGLLREKRPLEQMQMQFLAKAHHVKWTPAFQNPKAVEQVARGADELFLASRKNPKLIEADPSTPNPDWFGLGAAGDAIRLLAGPLQPFLGQTVGDTGVSRREAWSGMLRASRDFHCRHRRQYTNQSMINDLYSYLANRGVAALDPGGARPEAEMRRYLYESVGLEPWLGSDTDGGPARPLGDGFLQLTEEGLTRELGYVGNYGEVLDWVAQIYDATREPGGEGDPRIKAQLAKIIRARGVFRHPSLDREGFRAMRTETVVGWRDTHFYGDVCYAERATWDGTPVFAPAITLDEESVGYVQQMFEDNQFFESLRDQMKNGSLRVTAGLLGAPDDYEALRARPPSGHRLPMSPGRPDFVFSDEDDGVVAIKRGDEVLYASLYWRARHAVNFLARVHHLTPRFDRIAVVRQETEFEPGGGVYTRPDWINFGFANGGHRYPGDLHSAHAGEKLPIARLPPGTRFRPGQEHPDAGRGTFYQLRFGDYLIGMNCTRERTFALRLPEEFATAVNLETHATAVPAAPVRVPPRSTVVLVRVP